MTINPAILLPLLLTLAGCASVPIGQTGASSTINGVELWKGGPPARPYRVLATISRQGPDTSATYHDEENAVAAAAHEQNADAAIILNEVMTVSRLDITDSRPLLAPKVEAELIRYQ